MKLIQPQDAIGKTVKDVYRDDTYILTLFSDETYTLIAACFGDNDHDGRMWPTFETEDEAWIGTVDDGFLVKHGFYTEREVENWFNGN